MDKVIESFNKLNLKAKKIEETMQIIPFKQQFLEELSILNENFKEIKKLEIEVKTSLNNKVLKDQFVKTNETMKLCELKMLFLMHHLEGQDGGSATFSINSTIDCSKDASMGTASHVKPLFMEKKVKAAKAIQFTAEITEDDFANLPAYMKLRSTLSEFQDFLNNIVIRTFNEKYRIMSTPRASLKTADLSLQSMFKTQAEFFQGQKFITVEDIARVVKKKNVDKKDDRYIQMLRHLQIIREARKNSICCYIWLQDV